MIRAVTYKLYCLSNKWVLDEAQTRRFGDRKDALKCRKFAVSLLQPTFDR